MNLDIAILLLAALAVILLVISVVMEWSQRNRLSESNYTLKLGPIGISDHKSFDLTSERYQLPDSPDEYEKGLFTTETLRSLFQSERDALFEFIFKAAAEFLDSDADVHAVHSVSIQEGSDGESQLSFRASIVR